jgi:hypothetical protein
MQAMIQEAAAKGTDRAIANLRREMARLVDEEEAIVMAILMMNAD